jgi:hypothetical protein
MNNKKKIHFEISERKILLRIIDVFAVLFSLEILNFIFNLKYFTISLTNYHWAVVLAFYINLIGTVFEMYNLQIASNQFKIIKSLILSSIFIVLCYLLTPILTPVLPLNRIEVFYFFVGVSFPLLGWRLFYQSFLASYRFEKKVIIVCDQEKLESLVKDLELIDPNYKVLAYVNSDDVNFNHKKKDYVQQIGINNLDFFIQSNNIAEIIIASQKTENFTAKLYNELLNLLERGFIIKEYIQVYEDMTQKIPIHQFDKDFYKYFPFSRSNQNQFYLIWMRLFDVFISSVGLFLGIMILPFILLGNAVGNRGTLFYSQIRVGKSGRTFEIFKFRTMVKNAETDGAIFSKQNDIRINGF